MLSNLAKLAAEKARDAAEEYFKLQNVDMAIKTLKAAQDFNPDLPGLDGYFTAYKVHELASLKSTWYAILDINDPEVDVGVIKKQYRRMALMLHPDKNSSVAADGAFKIIQSAMEVLTDQEKRNAYDSRFCPNKRKDGSSCSRAQEANDASDFPRARSHRKTANTSSGFRKTDTAESGDSRRQDYNHSRPQEAGDDSNFPRDPSHKTASNGSNKTDLPRSSNSRRQRYSVWVVISRRDGTRKIVISSNGRVADALQFDAKDESFDSFCSFFFGRRPPVVINCR